MQKLNILTAREYAWKFASNPVDGLILLDLEQINRGESKCGKKWQEFKSEATTLLEQMIKDAAIYAKMN